MNIIKNITTRNRTVKTSRTVKYIIMHWVGSVSTAKANSEYFKTAYRGASAHYFVDQDSIYQVVEDKDLAWATGARTYYHPDARNVNSLNIEMCLDAENHIADATISATAELVKAKMAEYNVPAENVIRHYDVTHKACPGPYVDANAWADLHAKLTQMIKSTPAKPQGDEWVRQLQAAIGASVDGIAGPETLSKCPTIKYGSRGKVVLYLQEKFNSMGIGVGTADGIAGAKTKAGIMEFQKMNRLTIDGIFGQNSWKKMLGL